MAEIIRLASPALETSFARLPERNAPAIRTDAVYVVFTSIDETLAAVHIAAPLAKAMAAPLILIHFRIVPYPLSPTDPVERSPVEMDGFVERLRAEGHDVGVRVYVSRDEHLAIPLGFKRHSLIVIAGRRSWWPNHAEQWRRRLEAAGHFVVFVDTSRNKSAHA
jgi:hypothetical protein